MSTEIADPEAKSRQGPGNDAPKLSRFRLPTAIALVAPAADKARRFAWLGGAACALCCLLPVLGVAGVAGLFSAIGFRDVVISLVITVVAGGGLWLLLRRRRHRCAGDSCGCPSSGS